MMPHNCAKCAAKKQAEAMAAQSAVPPMVMARYVGESVQLLTGPVTGAGYGRADHGKIVKVFSRDVDGITFEAL